MPLTQISKLKQNILKFKSGDLQMDVFLVFLSIMSFDLNENGSCNSYLTFLSDAVFSRLYKWEILTHSLGILKVFCAFAEG